jgi:2-polyprenyl-3-methyl-5-hydroxy-6-metoxy-1,4-benzoquinol methylase
MMVDEEATFTGTDYHDKFDSTSYFEMYNQEFSAYSKGLPNHFLRHYHNAFENLSQESVSVLDFGSGPSVLGGISASLKASEIILSDYTEDNQQAASRWLRNEPTAFDWSSYFQYVVQELEGKDKKEIKAREELVRKVVKAVVPCDINKDPPLPAEYNKQYDVVICCLVLACSTQTHDEYKAGMNRLGKLLKRGGSLLFFGVERTADVGFYRVGNRKFRSVGVSSEFAVKAMEHAGISNVMVDKIPAKNEDETVVGYMFIKGTKL